jgi:hypothetical protein
MPVKYTTSSFIEVAKQKFGDRYDYSGTLYVKSTLPISVHCVLHGTFHIIPAQHLRGKGGCKQCKSENASARRKSVQSFIEAACQIHGTHYDYSLVVYRNRSEKVEIVCPSHGSFFQRPYAHLAGQGCIHCAGFGLLNTKLFIERARAIHGDIYDYSGTEYLSTNKPVTYICSIHGHITQIAANHLNGSGCSICKGYSWGHEEFLRRAVAKHGNFYSYVGKYQSAFSKIEIKCPKHGVFLMRPSNHLSGQGCRKCSSSISRAERLWLDSLGIPEDHRQKSVKIAGKKYVFDALVPETNTVYEFWGDKWHGNPDKFDPEDTNPVCKLTYGELYARTQLKRLAILKAGYRLVEIWESDWLSHM